MLLPPEPTAEQIECFNRDGFLVVPRIIEPEVASALAERFAPMFRGEFETGLYPDEWNWREGRDPEDLTRQICNGWKSDRAIARTVLDARIGRWSAKLRGWRGARINQDNLLWKPPGAKSLGFHQDDGYQAWVVPGEMMTCWISLDDTSVEGGTLEYVRGSHAWGVSPPSVQFHAPEDRHSEMRAAAERAGVEPEPEIIPVVVPAGGGAFHHGTTYHGSGVNDTASHRRALVAHCISSEARFHPSNVGYIYSRYKRIDTDEMDESFFPILWREDGYRTAFLAG